MNRPASPHALSYQNNDGIDLATYLAVIYDNRWLIIKITLLALVLGIGIAITSTPIYQANMVLQIEDSSPKNALGVGDLSSMFEFKAAASSEMEILRTRMIVSHAVDALKLNITVKPKYFPRIGQWIAAHNQQLSTPGLFGYGGYVWGAEKIGVATFSVPEGLQGKEFVLVAREEGGFTLSMPETGFSATGRTGRLLVADTVEGPVELMVEKLEANPGAEFILVHRSRLAAVKELQATLQITEAGRMTGIVNVALPGANPKLTAEVLNEIGRQYLNQNIQRRSEEAEKSLAFLNKQLPELKQQLEQSELKYNQFRNANGSVNLGEEASHTLQQSVAAQAKLMVAKQKRDALLFEATPEHPAVKALDNDIRVITDELNGITGRVKKLPAVEQEMLRLSRDVKVNTDLYTALLNSSQQLRLVKAGKVGNTRLLDAAVVPDTPVSPNNFLIMGVALAGGLFTGVVSAFFRKSLSGGIDDPEEAERLVGVPVYATIPHSNSQRALQDRAHSRSKQLPVLARIEPDDIAIESLRSLRTTLQSSTLLKSNNVIVITGPTPRMGKSFIAANLAAVLAASGKTVLLIDADMRRGHLHQYFNLSKRNGLSELIEGVVNDEQAVQRNILPDVDLITAGTCPRSPSDMLLNKNFGNLLKRVSSEYDYVLLDCPPVLAVSDSMVVASHAGLVLLVTRAGISTGLEIKESLKRLDKVMHGSTCVVLNDVKARIGNYYYAYRYERLDSPKHYSGRDDKPSGRNSSRFESSDDDEMTWVDRRSTNYGVHQAPRVTYFAGKGHAQKDSEVQ